MIDEKKLLESLIPILNEHGDMYFAGRIIGMVNSQPKIGEWIPCSKQLPEKTGCFLVCYKGGGVAVAKYGYNTTHEYKCFWIGYIREENIIAWQPLPESYKE